MKLDFSLGLYWPCSAERRLLQEQLGNVLELDSQGELDQLWFAKLITARAYPSNRGLVLETWSSAISYCLPIKYGELACYVRDISLSDYYVFASHGLDGCILQDPLGYSIALSRKESKLLAYLMCHEKGRKKDLLEHVLGYHPELYTHTVESHLSTLRQKLQTTSCDPFEIIHDNEGYVLFHSAQVGGTSSAAPVPKPEQHDAYSTN